ncbi:hypothetical protein N7454_005889 [Penicillium verhagenii]|nr:hypothetical protein N7454_005889 [Penicillium verhagenii]
MASSEEKDEIRDQIAKELSQTPFECISLTRLSGGTANFVYRGVLTSSGDSIIIKHSKDYVASNPNFKIDITRCHFEEAILQALDGFQSRGEKGPTVKTPRVLYFNKETNTQIIDDLPQSLNLKDLFLSDSLESTSEFACREIGSSLGVWLQSFHKWGNKPEQAESRSLITQNVAMKQLKFYINYAMLVDTIATFPDILEESRGTFEELRNFATEEMKKSDKDPEIGIIHGDFWTGNVLIPNSPLAELPATTLFVIDWELCQVGPLALDLAQMIAELYELNLFKNLDYGLWVVKGFMAGYGPLTDEKAFRTAIHVGVHLIVWGSRVQGWGTLKQVTEVVEMGKDIIVQGWNKNKKWFEDSDLGCLFSG